ncbi:GL1D1 protein, partial [Polypterus senegalus]
MVGGTEMLLYLSQTEPGALHPVLPRIVDSPLWTEVQDCMAWQGHLREYIEAAGHICCLRDVADFKTPEEVTHLILEEEFDGCLAIHLYKGGRLLLGTSAPFGVVLGGTDINEDVKYEVKREVMGKVIQKARCVSLGDDSVELFRAEVVLLFLFIYFNLIYELMQNVNHTNNVTFQIDPAFTEEVTSSVKRANGVLLASERPQGELQAAMKTSFALVNSSISEGMSAAVLEEFIQLSKKLMQDASLRQRLVVNAKAYVTERHSTDNERSTYQQLIHLLK